MLPVPLPLVDQAHLVLTTGIGQLLPNLTSQDFRFIFSKQDFVNESDRPFEEALTALA